MRKSQNNSRNKSETEDAVFDKASGGDTRKSTRERKQTERFEAGASCNAFDSRQNFAKIGDRARVQTDREAAAMTAETEIVKATKVSTFMTKCPNTSSIMQLA